MILIVLYFISFCITGYITIHIARLLILISRIRARRHYICTQKSKPTSVTPERNCKLMVVLGSGGHTAEMLTLVQDALHHTRQPTKITYLVGATDKHSAEKAIKMHTDSNEEALKAAKVSVIRLPRAREVGQSWLSSIVTTSRTAVSAMGIVAKEKPDLVLCNGPGTSAVVAACALLLRARAGAEWGRVIYVESFARVITLSLSGRFVYIFADRFVVQWESLTTFRLAEFYGRLC